MKYYKIATYKAEDLYYETYNDYPYLSTRLAGGEELMDFGLFTAWVNLAVL